MAAPAPRWNLATGQVPKWDRKVFARFQKKHGLTQARFIELMRSNGFPTMNPVQLGRWQGGQEPRAVTVVALYNALDAVEAALEKGA